MSVGDYAEHTVALRAIVSELEHALRAKEYQQADKLASEAMKRLVRIHGWISFTTGSTGNTTKNNGRHLPETA